jgi:hypothetical protein
MTHASVSKISKNPHARSIAGIVFRFLGLGLRPIPTAALRLGVLLLALALAACRSTPDTPEGQIRAEIARAEQAAEEKDIGTLKGLVSDAYRGDEGLDKKTLALLLAQEFMRHQSIHLFTRISSIEIDPPGQARVVAFVAMAGRPIASPDELAAVRADVYRYDLELAEEEPRHWRVTSATWRPAEMEDLG